MPTGAKMIPHLSRKDGDPQKQYPIGGTYLSIPYKVFVSLLHC